MLVVVIVGKSNLLNPYAMPDLKKCDGTVVCFSPKDACVLDWMSEDHIRDLQFETSVPEHHAADLVDDCFPSEPV